MLLTCSIQVASMHVLKTVDPDQRFTVFSKRGKSGFSRTRVNTHLLSCQPRVTVTSCFVYEVNRELESIDHLCINPIRRIGLILK